MINWKTEKRKISDLKLWDKNPRKISKEALEKLKERIEQRGFHDVLKITQDNVVLSGNQRLKVLKEMKIEKVDVKVPDRKLTEEEKEKVALESNMLDGDWDNKLLKEFDENLLKEAGFDSGELDEIFEDEIDDQFDTEKELNKILKSKARRVKNGDIWQLGEHKLLIGDCVNKENWEKLLGKERFDFMFTDPPYQIGANIGKKKKGHHNYKIKVKTKKGFGYKGQRRYDGLQERGGVPLFDEWLSIAKDYQNVKGANIMIFENWKNTIRLWKALEKYWKIRNLVIWWLPNRSQGFSAPHKFFSKYDIAPLAGNGVLNKESEEELEDYLEEKGQKLLDTYEVILYAKQGKGYWDKKKGTRFARVNDHISWTAETGKSSGQSLIFGTKPIQILVPYIKILSPRDGIVAEPFAGSGSTIIACEIMKRKCRAIEISPIYGEVILMRWEKFTNQKAKKLSSKNDKGKEGTTIKGTSKI